LPQGLGELTRCRLGCIGTGSPEGDEQLFAMREILLLEFQPVNDGDFIWQQMEHLDIEAKTPQSTEQRQQEYRPAPAVEMDTHDDTLPVCHRYRVRVVAGAGMRMRCVA